MKEILLGLLILFSVATVVSFGIHARKTHDNNVQKQYHAWTNYTKRTDIKFTEFVQLKDIGVLQ